MKLIKAMLLWLWGFAVGVFVCLAIFHAREFIALVIFSGIPAAVIAGGWIISNWNEE